MKPDPRALPEEAYTGWLDDELDEALAAEVERALAADDEAAAIVEDLRAIRSAAAELAPPSPGPERWARFERDFSAALASLPARGTEADRASPRAAPITPSPFVRLLPLALAAAAGLMLMVLLNTETSSRGDRVALAFQRKRFEPADFVPPPASPPNPLPRAATRLRRRARAKGLRPELIEDLASTGLALSLARDDLDLAERYRRWLGEPDRVIVTPELAVLLAEGAVRRAIAAVELRAIAPGLKDVLGRLTRALLAYRATAIAQEARLGVDRALEITAVGALLAGDRPSLPRGLEARCRAEVGRIEAAEGPAWSELLLRQEDYDAYRVRDAYRDEPALFGHFRAVVWLTRSPLRIDADHPEECRAAAMLVAAAARAKQFKAWSRLEDLIEQLFGRADGLSLFDVRRALQTTLGDRFSGPDALNSPRRLSRFIAALEREAEARAAGMINPGQAPEVRLFGAVRSLDNLAVAALTDDRRPEPTLLDLPYLFGSPAAAPLLATEEGNLDGLAAGARRFRAGLLTRLGATALPDRGRAYAARALGHRPGADPERYARRLLLAADACFQPRSAAAALPLRGARALAPLYVEPQAPAYARLAHALRSAAGLISAHLPAAQSRGLRADLLRITGLLEAFAASNGDRPLPPAVADELLSVLPAFRPAAAWTCDHLVTLKSPRGDIQVQRASGGADLLYLALADGGLARGAIFSLREARSPRRLSGAEAALEGKRPYWVTSWAQREER